jgi:hypothetical protein
MARTLYEQQLQKDEGLLEVERPKYMDMQNVKPRAVNSPARPALTLAHAGRIRYVRQH